MPPAETPEFWLTLRLWCRKQWDIDALYPLSLYSESRERGAKRTLYTEIKVLCKPAAGRVSHQLGEVLVVAAHAVQSPDAAPGALAVCLRPGDSGVEIH